MMVDDGCLGRCLEMPPRGELRARVVISPPQTENLCSYDYIHSGLT
jgi:hypothetical protein